MKNSVGKYKNQKREYFDRAKNITFRLRRMGELNSGSLDRLVAKDMDILNKYYLEHYYAQGSRGNRVRCFVESALYKALRSGDINRNIKIMNSIIWEKDKPMSFIEFFSKYINKDAHDIIVKYYQVLIKLNISKGSFKRFLALYAIFKTNKLDLQFIDSLVISNNEKYCLRKLLSNNKINFKKLTFDITLIEMVKTVDGYIAIADTTIYDDDSLKYILRTKSSIFNTSNFIDCTEAIENIVDMKISYFKQNFVSKSDLKCVKRFKFKYNIVQNTIFIKSKLDDWYVNVSKQNKRCILYHGNDGMPDTYHYQKTFNHIDLYKIFDYIEDHDEYSLNRFEYSLKRFNEKL